MMQQQVNLYHFLPQRPKLHLTVEILSFWYAVFFLLLMLDYSYGLWKKHQAVVQLTAVSAQYDIEQEKMTKLGQQYGATNPQDLQGSLLQLEKNLEFHSKMIAQLFQQVTISAYMQAFAGAIIPGVWLTEFNVSANEQKIDLKGHALQAIEVESFRDQLQRQPIFSGITFVLQDLIQPTSTSTSTSANENNHLDFYITTKAGK